MYWMCGVWQATKGRLHCRYAVSDCCKGKILTTVLVATRATSMGECSKASSKMPLFDGCAISASAKNCPASPESRQQSPMGSCAKLRIPVHSGMAMMAKSALISRSDSEVQNSGAYGIISRQYTWVASLLHIPPEKKLSLAQRSLLPVSYWALSPAEPGHMGKNSKFLLLAGHVAAKTQRTNNACLCLQRSRRTRSMPWNQMMAPIWISKVC